ncbi:MAG: carboxypeptidase regulatory-like domain-containing protein [Flavobacteriales bacterium]|nr:carboxypeptidase regulatory-like domain-containing protein [Flavobacteriales bacterium]
MIRRFTVSLLMMLAVAFASAQGGSIKGKVLDPKGEPVPFANVALYQNGNLKTGVTTDFDGEYKINNVDAGTYTLKVSSVEFQPYQIDGLVVKSNQILPLDDILLGDNTLAEVKVVTYKVPLIDKDGGASGGTVTREDIAKMPGRSATSIAATVGGVSTDGTGAISSVRGSRGDATYYYIDGIKVRGSSSLPKAAIEEVAVMTGGLPANYGDATGGIISITTRGASSFFFGGVEAVTSGFKVGDNKSVGLDKYGYNLVEGILSGPLLMKKDSTGKKTEPILGFFVSGNFTHQLDPRPFAIDQYRLRPDVRAMLSDTSEAGMGYLRPAANGIGTYYNTDFLKDTCFEKVNFRQNVASTAVSLAGKIDVNAGPNVNLTFGGSGNFNRRHVSDDGSSSGMSSNNNMLMNYENNPLVTDFDWRAYGKFTQRFQSQLDESGKSAGISNAYYTIMVDYSKSTQVIEDDTHEDRYFNYGYVGKFETIQEKTYEFQDTDGDLIPDTRVHNGYNDVQVIFTPSEQNSDLAGLTEQYFNLYDDVTDHYEDFSQIRNGGALVNGERPDDVYDLWRNIGYTYNSSSKQDNSQFRVTAMGSADIGDHAITLGFEYEQRVDRRFAVSPVGLWGNMRLLANSHIQELDVENPYITNFGSYQNYDYERLNAAPGEYSASDAQSFFDYNLRNALGYDTDGVDYIDLDAVDPNLMTLDMFSADELLNNGNQFVSYYGYDHTGKKLSSKASFDDFFNATDAYGNPLRSIGAYEPIYIAGYIMDKFAFDDLIFNVGLRVDRFDANQMVLKDKYLTKEAKTIADVSEIGGSAVSHPENLPTSAVVYVNDINDPTAIAGYRVGSVWYNSAGTEISNPQDIKGSRNNDPDPYLNNVTHADEIQSSAFEDYKPQITVMPRVAFSFPISDEALFFAHYDVLSKRPTTGNRLNITDYYFLDQGLNNTLNNPDLKPEKTIDYELGFQQVLTKKSSLKISGFYREMRNQVTLVNVAGAYPNSYRTYGNRDFGTVKGLTVSYDLRRSGNITMRASYTLQFAEGTGSDPQSQSALINSGQPNLRTIFPYNYDQRHQLTLTMDYRYGEGKDYNGPTIGGKQILKNTGANLVSYFASGTPYSAQEGVIPTAFIAGNSGGIKGTVNGSRKPGTFRSDLQIDRNFMLKFGEGEDAKTANLNVYLLVNNVFNFRNVLDVYRATGNAEDDGYLNAAQYQNQIESRRDSEAFINYYLMKMNDPYNFGLPRTIRLGVKLDF